MSSFLEPEPDSSPSDTPLFIPSPDRRRLGVIDITKRTVELLNGFFSGTLSEEESAECAARLVFPHKGQDVAVKLYRAHLEYGIEPDEEARLKGFGRFPLSPRGAELFTRSLVSRERMALSERLALYALSAHPDNPEAAEELRATLLRTAAECRKPGVSPARITREVIFRIKESLQFDSSWVPGIEELCDVTGISVQQIEDILSSHRSGISGVSRSIWNRDEGEWKVRQELRRWLDENPLFVPILNATRIVVKLENALFRHGLVSSISERSQLGTFLEGASFESSSNSPIEGLGSSRYLRFLALSDFLERESIWSAIDRPGDLSIREEVDALLERVLHQIESYKRGEVSKVDSFSELGSYFGLEPVSVFHYTRKYLDPDVFASMRNLVASRSEQEEFLLSPAHFHAAQLRSFKKGEITRVLTGEELSHDVFPTVTRSALTGSLDSDEAILSPGLLTDLRRIQYLQPHSNSVSDALAEMWLRPLLGRIALERLTDPQPLKTSPLHDRREDLLHGISIEERALLHVLSQFGFHKKLGETWQVPNGKVIHDVVWSGRIGRRIGHYVIEWHSDVHRDITKDEFKLLKDARTSLVRDSGATRPHQRRGAQAGNDARFRKWIEQGIGDNYAQERSAALAGSEDLRDATLVVLKTPSGLYHFLEFLGFSLPPFYDFELEWETFKMVARKEESSRRQRESAL